MVDSQGAFATGTVRVAVVAPGQPQPPLAVEDRLTVEPGRTAIRDRPARFFDQFGLAYISTENAYVKAHIAQISAEVAGRVLEVHIRDHADVKAGDVLFSLDPEPFRVALAKAAAELDSTRSQVRTLVAAWHEAKSELQEADSKVAYWNAQLARQKTLAERGIVSSSKFEEVENNATAAVDRVSVMRKKVERVGAQLVGDPERPVDEHPMVREKQAERERAATRPRPHRDPRAARRHRGQRQAAEGRADQGGDAAVRAGRRRRGRGWRPTSRRPSSRTCSKGLVATVVLDIYPDVVWQAEVESISPATGAEFALLPPQNASGNWVKVVQRLPVRVRLLPQPGEPPLRAGMTATVKIDTGRERRLSSMFGGWTAVATSR